MHAIHQRTEDLVHGNKAGGSVTQKKTQLLYLLVEGFPAYLFRLVFCHRNPELLLYHIGYCAAHVHVLNKKNTVVQ